MSQYECCTSAVTGKRTEPTGTPITTTLRMLTLLCFHVAQDKNLQCMWKNRIKFGGHGRCKNMPRSLQPSTIFSSFIWQAFIYPVSLCWLFGLVAHSLSGPIHSWYSLFFLTSFLSSELIFPCRYQERATNSGRKEHLKQLTAGS